MHSLCDGRYQLQRVFSDSGGMGLIYEARDLVCAGNRVLLKTMRYDSPMHAGNFAYTGEQAADHVRKLRSIIEWEKKMMIRLKDLPLNNIPNLNDFFIDRTLTLKGEYQGKMGPYRLQDELLANEPYLVIEKIAGRSLEDLVQDPGWRARAERQLLQLTKELCTILIKLHRPFEVKGREAYFIFQDLKPGNVLVSGGGQFTLIDLGGVTLRLGSSTTEPTAGVFTQGYAAPEAKGNESLIDHRFDIYSLGATLYHAFTGIDPRDLGSEYPTLDPGPVKALPVSSQTRRLVLKAIARDPAQRYQSAAEMRRDTMEALRG